MGDLHLVRAVLYACLASTALAGSAGAQDVQVAPAAATAEAPRAAWDGDGARPRKIDEFGRVGGCDHSARLDNFAIELMNDPGAVGYIITYGPAGTGNGTAFYRAEVSENYLTNSRGLEPGRVRTVNGGRYKARDESFTELWIAPPGAAPPDPYAEEEASEGEQTEEGNSEGAKENGSNGSNPDRAEAVRGREV
jgi:hypothetical protein